MFNRSYSGFRSSNNTVSPVTTIYALNGVDRADIYIGFQFDGFMSYDNITAVLPNTTFVFFPQPTVGEGITTDIQFDPNVDKTLVITVIVLTSALLLH